MVSKRGKHLSKEERNIIESMLTQSYSLTYIAKTISRDKTTISKEIKNHRKLKYPDNITRNLCINRSKCKLFNCDKHKSCYDMFCPSLKKSPYVCNGCEKKYYCRLVKYYYDAREANNEYLDTLSSSRTGIRLSKQEENDIEKVIYDLIKIKNQSVNEIYINNPDILTFSKPTFYSYVNNGVFHLKNIDLRRKVSYKPRENGKKITRKDSKIRIKRTYEDFLNFSSLHPNFSIVEMDTVEGTKGGKVFLTFLFRKSNLMLIFLLESKTMEWVIHVFDSLKKTLGPTLFKSLFRIVLTDNGPEFFDPDSIERFNGKKIINLFYCDPGKSWQKGSIEKNHEYIRYVLPKGSTFDFLTQDDVNLLSNHINNTPRGVLKNMTPYNAFIKQYGKKFSESVFHKLNVCYIKPNDVDHSKKLLSYHNERKKSLMKLINDLEHYYQFKHFKLDNKIKLQIINQYIDDWYLYTDEDLFYHSVNFIDKISSK